MNRDNCFHLRKEYLGFESEPVINISLTLGHKSSSLYPCIKRCFASQSHSCFVYTPVKDQNQMEKENLSQNQEFSASRTLDQISYNQFLIQNKFRSLLLPIIITSLLLYLSFWVRNKFYVTNDALACSSAMDMLWTYLFCKNI